MRTKQRIEDVVKKLDGYLAEMGLSPEVRKSSTGAIISARSSTGDEPLQVVVQVNVGEAPVPTGHGSVARETIARHILDVAIRPTLGARSAASSRRAVAGAIALSHEDVLIE
ncbi:MAG TPA: hypothetical protein VGT98_10155 [Candidatus Elarobacter sp.]|nr:hypothetical protein [Candidatus Elarobacter sp.]HEV2739066.1 hypothetical protein [Candidatus Elarobacter sp.]